MDRLFKIFVYLLFNPLGVIIGLIPIIVVAYAAVGLTSMSEWKSDHRKKWR